MKKNFIIIILLVLCEYLNAQNLVQNPYFTRNASSGADFWTVTNSPTFSVNFRDAQSWVPDAQTYMAFYNANAYSATVTQTITGVPNGIYSLTCQTQGTNLPGHEMFVNGFGSAERAVVAPSPGSGWATASITNITVTNGQITIGFRTGASPAGSYRNFTKAILIQTGTLPVSLTSYTASVKNNFIQLDWKTVSEQNNEYFTILKSLDGKLFENIGRVNGVGNSDKLQNYSFVDKNPSKGVAYYKLMQYDFDGKEAELGIKTVSINMQDDYLTTYPNPASDYIRINTRNNKFTGTMSVKLYDLNGAILMSKSFGESSNEIELPLINISSGKYLVSITSNDQVIIKKIIVAK
jgi:hypothetical protein